jgi:cysteine synthase
VGATDGNFGLALAFVCADFKIKLDLFVPHVISHFKIENILYVAKDWVTIHKLESIYVDVSIAAE